MRFRCDYARDSQMRDFPTRGKLPVLVSSLSRAAVKKRWEYRMIEPRGVAHFSIAVSDLDASQRFYTEILGLTLVQAAPATGMVFLRAGDDHVILARSDAPLQRNAKDSRRAHHAFKVDPGKYQEAKAFLVSRGIDIFEEEDRKKGVFVGRQFYIHDPDGTVIEFTEWDGTSRLD
jgi:catechol 2,3-dioxygenase-like lactoylglutathione lyase family enzyme